MDILVEGSATTPTKRTFAFGYNCTEIPIALYFSGDDYEKLG